MKLFAVYLGGTAPKANTELHDLVFAVGDTIESTYEQLMDAWFGSIDGIHLDSWVALEVVDGYRVTLNPEKSVNPLKLFFVNLGAYIPGELIEVHKNTFLVGEEKRDIIKRAIASCSAEYHKVHRDYLYDVDECIEVNEVNRLYVHLEPTTETVPFEPHSAYSIIPKAVVAEYKSRKRI